MHFWYGRYREWAASFLISKAFYSVPIPRQRLLMCVPAWDSRARQHHLGRPSPTGTDSPGWGHLSYGEESSVKGLISKVWLYTLCYSSFKWICVLIGILLLNYDCRIWTGIVDLLASCRSRPFSLSYCHSHTVCGVSFSKAWEATGRYNGDPATQK